jgi:hypothetical protein
MRKSNTHLFWGPGALSDISTIIQESKNLLDASLLLKKFLHLKTLATSSSKLLDVLKGLLCELNIFDTKFLTDNCQISNRIDITLNVYNFSIIETSDNLEDSIDSTDM